MAAGKLPYDGEHINDGKNGRDIWPNIKIGLPFDTGGFLELNNRGSSSDPDFHFLIQFNETHERAFRDFKHLKEEVIKASVNDSTHNARDRFLVNLHHAVTIVETHKTDLEKLVFFRRKERTDDNTSSITFKFSDSSEIILVPGRYDICECTGLLKCPNGTKTISQGSSSIEECIWDGYNVLERTSLVPTSNNFTNIKNSSDFKELSSTLQNTIGTLELHPYEVAVFELDLSDIPTNMTYGNHYRLALYEDCKPCPPMYICDKEDSCSSPSMEEQFVGLNKCLRQYRHDVCVHANGTSVDAKWCKDKATMYVNGYYPLGHPNANANSNGTSFQIPIPEEEKLKFESNFLLYTEPDLHKCLSIPIFCKEKNWNQRIFRKLCQDVQEDGTTGPIYDCTAVGKWNHYIKWKNKVCCSDNPEFGELVACMNNTCSSDPVINNIFMNSFHMDFVSKYGYEPPLFEPKGSFLMNATLQEDKFNPDPYSLFNLQASGIDEEEQDHESQYIFNVTEMNPWMKTKGCCNCQPYPLPQFFEKNVKVSGYPDDKHRKLQFTITALRKVDLTIVLELLHGQYYKDFQSSFVDEVDKSLHIHRPNRFDSSLQSSMWLSILDKHTVNSIPIDLPLNLPMKVVDGIKSFENSILVDQLIS